MKIVIDASAAKWMTQALNLREGDSVRFTIRYGGHSSFQPGFSIGLSVEPPQNIAASQDADGVLYYVRDEDLWYFDGHDLHVEYLNDEDGVDYKVDESRNLAPD